MPSQSPSEHPLHTQVFSGSSELDLSNAATMLQNGQLVAFPTETVYGLGGLATSTPTISALYAAKNRPPDNPLIVHLSSTDDLSAHVLTPLPLSPLAQKLTDRFWPGPLTLILPLADRSPLSPLVTAGLRTVAIRVPRHPVAASLLSRAAVPIAAPSANRSGRPSPTAAAHVMTDLAGHIDGLVDGGDAVLHHGVESTVVDLTDLVQPRVLRPGAVSAAELEELTGVSFLVGASCGNGEAPRAPGMKYRHYAPRAPMRLVERRVLREQIEACGDASVGVLADAETCSEVSGMAKVLAVECGRRGDVASFARDLYASLRAFDGEGDIKAAQGNVTVILAVPPENVEDGMWEAVMNRLRKAADQGYVGTALVKEK